MKNLTRFIPILLLFLLVSSLAGVYYNYQTYRILQPTTSIDFGSTLTSNPNPAATGPYSVCTFDYDFSPDDKQWWRGRIYIPVTNDNQCAAIEKGGQAHLNRKFNLVIIAHADGQGTPVNAHLNYQSLATHLASNAMIVVSLNRYALQTVTGASDYFDQVLNHHLEYLYNESTVRNFLTDNIAIIGHSAGGRSVIRHADAIEAFGKNLRSTILLAPTVNLTDPIAFEHDTESFLGIQVTQDMDFSAFGAPVPNSIMQTSFEVYDALDLSSHGCREKDMLYVTHIGHYFQNAAFTLAYVNAYLQLHLNGHNIFERFFKYQQRPPSLVSATLWQQHDEWHKYVLDDFEQVPEFVTTGGGPVTFSGITGQEVDWTYLNDLFSPHNTHALRVAGNNQGPAQITLNFFVPVNLSGYPFLGFRVSQIYDQENNTTGNPINFRMRLNTNQGLSAWVSAQDHGGALHFPPVVMAPVNPPLSPATQANGNTKNAMRSYLIRLSEFANADVTQVQSLTFDFGSSNQLQLVLDDVVFYGF